MFLKLLCNFGGWGELQHAVIIVNFLYGPIELGLNLHIYLLQNQNINDADIMDMPMVSGMTSSQTCDMQYRNCDHEL